MEKEEFIYNYLLNRANTVTNFEPFGAVDVAERLYNHIQSKLEKEK